MMRRVPVLIPRTVEALESIQWLTCDSARISEQAETLSFQRFEARIPDAVAQVIADARQPSSVQLDESLAARREARIA